MRIKPINKKIIVEIWERKSKILVTETDNKEKIFVVIDSDNEEIKKGTKVLIDEYAGKEKIIEGKTIWFIDFDDIIAIIE